MSTSFAVSAQTLITSVLRAQGWLDYQSTPDATKLANMLEALEILLKGWSQRGLKIWCIEQVTVPLVAGNAQYSMGVSGIVSPDRPLRIEQITINNVPSAQQRIIYPISRQEYLNLGNLTSSGPPSQYFYDPQITNGQLYLYPTPDFYTVANYTCFAYIRRYIQDVGALSATVQVPQEWYQPLKWGLAYETMEENQVTPAVATMITAKYKEFVPSVEDWDREYSDVLFGLNPLGEDWDRG